SCAPSEYPHAVLPFATESCLAGRWRGVVWKPDAPVPENFAARARQAGKTESGKERAGSFASWSSPLLPPLPGSLPLRRLRLGWWLLRVVSKDTKNLIEEPLFLFGFRGSARWGLWRLSSRRYGVWIWSCSGLASGGRLG